jgi:hypothetical protein
MSMPLLGVGVRVRRALEDAPVADSGVDCALGHFALFDDSVRQDDRLGEEEVQDPVLRVSELQTKLADAVPQGIGQRAPELVRNVSRAVRQKAGLFLCMSRFGGTAPLPGRTLVRGSADWCVT